MAKYIVRRGFGLFGKSYDVGEHYIEADAMHQFNQIAKVLGPEESVEIRKCAGDGEYLVAEKNTFKG